MAERGVSPHGLVPWTCYGRGAKSPPADPSLLGIRATGRIVVCPDGVVQFVGLERTGEIGRVCYAPNEHTPEPGSAGCDDEPPPASIGRLVDHPRPLGAAVLASAAAAVDAVQALDPGRIATDLRFEDSHGSIRVILSVAHANGGRGEIVIRAHHGYLYVDPSACSVPGALTAAARDAVRAVAEDAGLRLVG